MKTVQVVLLTILNFAAGLYTLFLSEIIIAPFFGVQPSGIDIKISWLIFANFLFIAGSFVAIFIGKRKWATALFTIALGYILFIQFMIV